MPGIWNISQCEIFTVASAVISEHANLLRRDCNLVPL